MEEEYRYLAASQSSFVAQAVQYASKGYYYYLCCRVPDRKDPAAVDKKMLDRYDIRTRRWQRKTRNRGDAAAIHYLRFDRIFVIMLTEGRRDDFYDDNQADVVRDLRREGNKINPLKVFGYAIESIQCPVERRRKVVVRLTPKAEQKLKQHLLKIATCDGFKDPNKLEREVWRLPYQPYEKVYEQLVDIISKANRARRRQGFPPISLDCIRKFRTIRKIFVDQEIEAGALP